MNRKQNNRLKRIEKKIIESKENNKIEKNRNRNLIHYHIGTRN